jgi:dolichol-phosphate mannosyltransferase
MVNYNLIRYFLSKGGSLLSKLFFKINLKDTTSGFQMFRHHVLKKIIKNRIISKDRFFQTEIKIYTRKLKQKEIPITYTCKTKTVRLSSIIESIILLYKIFIKKQNYIKN